eukprot:14278501-Heterocapsa_arctica.AAC.1
MGTFHAAYLKAVEEPEEANTYQAGCVGTEIAAKKARDQATAGTRILEAKVQASKPQPDILGKM